MTLSSIVHTGATGAGVPERPDDFFEAQRRERIRSRLLIGSIFVFLWLLANWPFWLTYGERVCDPVNPWVCDEHFVFNVRTALLTALAVGGYLAVAHWRAKRWAVVGQPATGSQHAQLRNVVEEMALAAGIPTPASYVVNDPALNAYAVSDGRRNGAVVVTTGLLAATDRRELKGVIAHEVAHIRNRDSSVILVAVMSVGLVVVLATIAWAIAHTSVQSQTRAQSRGDRESGLAWGIAFVTGVVAAILWCLAVPIALLLEAGLSRRRESLADASAVQFTRDPTGLRSALEKMAASPTPTNAVNAANAALWLDCPQRLLPGRGVERWLNRWLATHPPIERRIAWLRALEGASR